MSSATKAIRFLTTSQIKELYGAHIGKAAPIQISLLESAVASPINIKHYSHQSNIFQLAAALSEKIMLNHAFVDGNKRAALAAADMFLKINGHQLQATVMQEDKNNGGLVKAHVAVVTRQWDAERLGKYYESIATPVESWTEEVLEYRRKAEEH